LDGAILLVDGFVLGELDGTLDGAALGVEVGISDGISLGFNEGIIDTEGMLEGIALEATKTCWKAHY